MSTFYAQYASPAQITLGAQGTNGQTAPLVSLEMGAVDPSLDLQPLRVDSSGNLLVSLAAEPVTPFNVNLDSVGGVAITLGQKAMAASLPVVIASDQSPVHTIVDSSALPSGAATLAEQQAQTALLTTIDASDASIDSKLGTLGQKAMAGSAPVVIASDQSTLPVSAVSLPLPSGAATAANQATEIASLSAIDSSTASIDGKLGTLGQKAMADSAPVVIASDQSTLPVSAASLPLPSGAATAANQTNASQKTQIVDGSGNVIAATSNSLNVAVQSSALPSGAATAALQTTGNTSLSSIDTKTPALGQALAAASVPVVLTAAQISTLTPLSTIAATQSGTWTVQPGNTANTTPWLISESGFSAVSHATNAYASVNVTTAAYTQLIASTSAAAKEVEIFDSSGQSLVLAFGAAASEVDQVYIFPGGNGRIKLAVPASTRVSIKAVSANATSGNIYINLYG